MSDEDPTAMNVPEINEDVQMQGPSKQPAKDRALEILDILEGHVEHLRKCATQIEDDRDRLLISLDALRNTDLLLDLEEHERDDIDRYADRIISRCLTVDVKIHTQRDQLQEEALFEVNHLIDALVMGVKEDPDSTRSLCESYMNACSSNVVDGIVDKRFETVLLGCTMDDQKRVRKRLQGLWHYFSKLYFSTNMYNID